MIGRIVPEAAVEVIARTAGYLVRFIRPAHGASMERRVRGIFWGWHFGSRGVLIGRHVLMENIAAIQLGNNVRINAATQLIAGSHGWIIIGDDSHISRGTIIAGGGGITIGANCMISSNIALYSVENDLAHEQPHKAKGKQRPILIGDGAFIGAGAVILPGVSIGAGAAVGAGAVVTENVPDGYVAVGVPAKSKPRKALMPPPG
jgi:acetyltransferase-like isoleucine patch superfamily enzyme